MVILVTVPCGWTPYNRTMDFIAPLAPLQLCVSLSPDSARLDNGLFLLVKW